MAGNERVLHLTDDTFDAHIQKLRGPILVDFWAAWCGRCKQIAPDLDELAEELDGQATVAKVDVDDNDGIASRFGIRAIPTLVVFKNGRKVAESVGAVPKATMRDLLEQHLD